MLLPKIEMQASSLIAGQKYIWRVDGERQKVVWLNDEGDGLAEYEDEWWFDDGLIGELYGPFEIAL